MEMPKTRGTIKKIISSMAMNRKNVKDGRIGLKREERFTV
jgi:hypothetical protein